MPASRFFNEKLKTPGRVCRKFEKTAYFVCPPFLRGVLEKEFSREGFIL
jgi:hypothetical protein